MSSYSKQNILIPILPQKRIIPYNKINYVNKYMIRYTQ